MSTRSVSLKFSTEANAQTLASCLEQMLRHLSADPKEES